MPFQAVNQWLSNISGQTPINIQVPVNEKNKAVEKMMKDYYLMADQEVESKRRNDNRGGGRNKSAFRNSNNYNARRNDAHNMKPLSRSVAPKAAGRGKKNKDNSKKMNNRIRVGNKSYAMS